MSNCLHKRAKIKYSRCRHCHTQLTNKESYNTDGYSYWECEICGYHRYWYPLKELRGD